MQQRKNYSLTKWQKIVLISMFVVMLVIILIIGFVTKLLFITTVMALVILTFLVAGIFMVKWTNKWTTGQTPLSQLNSPVSIPTEDIIIIYHEFNDAWARWVRDYLVNRKGYKVTLKEWDGATNYRALMLKAVTDAKGVLTIISPYYMQLLYNYNAQNHTERKRTKRNRTLSDNEAFEILQEFNLLDQQYHNTCLAVDRIPRTIFSSSMSIKELDRSIRRVCAHIDDACSGITNRGQGDLDWTPNELPDNVEVWNIPQEQQRFAERRVILDMLQKRFRNKDGNGNIQRVRLTGLGGVGKTSIAIEYSQPQRSNCERILWISSSEIELNLTTIARNIINVIGASKNILTEQEKKVLLISNQVKPDSEELRTVIVQWLEVQERWRWLLVLDENPAIPFANINAFIPKMSREPGQVLITSAQSGDGESDINVRGLSDEEGASFLLGKTQHNDVLNDRKAVEWTYAKKISHALGGHPQALLYAVRDLSSSRPFKEYWEHYDADSDTIINRWNQRNFRTARPLFAWLPVYEAMQQERDDRKSASVELLQICSFFSMEKLPIVLIKTAIKACDRLAHIVHDNNDVHDILGYLMDLDFIEVENRDQETYIINPLIQAVIRHTLQPDEKYMWIERAIRALNSAFFVDDNMLSQSHEAFNWQTYQRKLRVGRPIWNIYELYLPHALACIKYIEKCDENRLHRTSVVRLYYILGCYYKSYAAYEDALKWLERALGARRRSQLTIVVIQTHERPDEATCRAAIAEVYSAVGYYIVARKEFLQILGERQKLLPANHPDIAHSLNALGELHRFIGQHKKAEEYFLEAQAIYKQPVGNDEIDAATCENNLGRLYQEWLSVEDPFLYQEWLSVEDPLPFYQIALAQRERLLGEWHPDVAQTKSNLAELLLSKDDYNGAAFYYNWAIKISNYALGETHFESIQLNANRETAITKAIQAVRVRRIVLSQVTAMGIDAEDVRTLKRYVAVLEGTYPKDLEDCKKTFTLKNDGSLEHKQHITIAERYHRMAMLCWYLAIGGRRSEPDDYPIMAQRYFEDALRTWPTELDNNSYPHLKKAMILGDYVAFLKSYHNHFIRRNVVVVGRLQALGNIDIMINDLSQEYQDIVTLYATLNQRLQPPSP